MKPLQPLRRVENYNSDSYWKLLEKAKYLFHEACIVYDTYKFPSARLAYGFCLPLKTIVNESIIMRMENP